MKLRRRLLEFAQSLPAQKAPFLLDEFGGTISGPLSISSPLFLRFAAGDGQQRRDHEWGDPRYVGAESSIPSPKCSKTIQAASPVSARASIIS